MLFKITKKKFIYKFYAYITCSEKFFVIRLQTSIWEKVLEKLMKTIFNFFAAVC